MPENTMPATTPANTTSSSKPSSAGWIIGGVLVAGAVLYFVITKLKKRQDNLNQLQQEALDKQKEQNTIGADSGGKLPNTAIDVKSVANDANMGGIAGFLSGLLGGLGGSTTTGTSTDPIVQATDNKIIQKGLKNDPDVKTLQNFLNSIITADASKRRVSVKRSDMLSVNGNYGSATEFYANKFLGKTQLTVAELRSMIAKGVSSFI